MYFYYVCTNGIFNQFVLSCRSLSKYKNVYSIHLNGLECMCIQWKIDVFALPNQTTTKIKKTWMWKIWRHSYSYNALCISTHIWNSTCMWFYRYAPPLHLNATTATFVVVLFYSSLFFLVFQALFFIFFIFFIIIYSFSTFVYGLFCIWTKELLWAWIGGCLNINHRMPFFEKKEICHLACFFSHWF